MALVGVMFSVGRSQEAPVDVDVPVEYDSFTLHPADDGAQRWHDLSPVEQVDVTRTAEWAEENAADVHAAFAASVGRTDELRDLQEAQSASGLEGVETLGVVP